MSDETDRTSGTPGQTAPETIPLTVLTGFLGSGKTTLLKRLLDDPAMAGTGVIINEFGEVGIDDSLVEKIDDDAVLLPSGCVCCEVRGDLVEALERMHTRSLWGDIPPVKRVVLETTGLADPAPIVHTIMTEERVYRIYQLDGVVTTVDGEHGLAQLDAEVEPAKQIAVADRVILTKTDLADADSLARLEGRVRALNKAAPILKSVKGDVAALELIGLGAHEPALAGTDVESWLAAGRFEPDHGGHAHEHDHTCGADCGHDHGGGHHHDHAHHDHDCADAACSHPDHHHGHLHGIQSYCLTFSEPLEGPEMSNALSLLAQLYGPKLLRVKGILNIKEQPNPFVVHGVQHIFYPPDTLKQWKGDDRRSRVVFITKDLPEATVRRHFKPFVGEAE
ncbi:MAG: GTP-binding protein [Hyphomicrobiaceae bacterium]